MQNQKTEKHKQKHSEQQKTVRVYCRYGEALCESCGKQTYGFGSIAAMVKPSRFFYLLLEMKPSCEVD